MTEALKMTSMGRIPPTRWAPTAANPIDVNRAGFALAQSGHDLFLELFKSDEAQQDFAIEARDWFKSAAIDELEVLSPREREVLQRIGQGDSSAEIAQALHISVRTVDTHRHNIMNKLDIHSIAGLTKFAIRHGLCELS